MRMSEEYIGIKVYQSIVLHNARRGQPMISLVGPPNVRIGQPTIRQFDSPKLQEGQPLNYKIGV